MEDLKPNLAFDLCQNEPVGGARLPVLPGPRVFASQDTHQQTSMPCPQPLVGFSTTTTQPADLHPFFTRHEAPVINRDKTPHSYTALRDPDYHDRSWQGKV